MFLSKICPSACPPSPQIFLILLSLPDFVKYKLKIFSWMTGSIAELLHQVLEHCMYHNWMAPCQQGSFLNHFVTSHLLVSDNYLVACDRFSLSFFASINIRPHQRLNQARWKPWFLWAGFFLVFLLAGCLTLSISFSTLPHHLLRSKWWWMDHLLSGWTTSLCWMEVPVSMLMLPSRLVPLAVIVLGDCGDWMVILMAGSILLL